ncbi:MAG: translation initiation factor IF-2 N-terminal domain-containing protein, partial [Hungatella hathewayi]|nr:translation initiation factor IF-2 N-terminal domain-containing protein [Hungatella hathewayi]
MRVSEFAKELGKSSKEVLEILQKNNFDVKSHASNVSDDQMAAVRRVYGGNHTSAGAHTAQANHAAPAAHTQAPAAHTQAPAAHTQAPAAKAEAPAAPAAARPRTLAMRTAQRALSP